MAYRFTSSVLRESAKERKALAQLSKFKLPLPPLALQREFAVFISQQKMAKASLKESLAALTAAQKSLMNSSFAKE